MYDDYDEVEALEAAKTLEPEIQAAAGVFEGMMVEMGVDPLDRGDWLGRFIAAHRAAVARESASACEG